MTQLKGFICYARADHDLVEVFHGTHLKSVEDDVGIEFWRDLERIRAGEHWNDSIARAIASSDVFLLLLSPAWRASSYIRDTELPRILARTTRHQTLVIPVLLSDCIWQSQVRGLQVVPLDGPKLVPIDKWKPPVDGHLAAARAIEDAILSRFNRVVREVDWENPAAEFPQDPHGPIWIVAQERLEIDRAGSQSDELAAEDPDTLYLHQRVRDKAAATHARTQREGNSLPGDWKPLIGLARNFADATEPDIRTVVDHLLPLWNTYNDLGSILARHKQRVAVPDPMNEPLPPEIAL